MCLVLLLISSFFCDHPCRVCQSAAIIYFYFKLLVFLFCILVLLLSLSVLYLGQLSVFSDSYTCHYKRDICKTANAVDSESILMKDKDKN